MNDVFILAASLQESGQIARLAGISPGGWDEPGWYNTRGMWNRTVLATNSQCWRSTRAFDSAERVNHIIATQGFTVISVPCPADWSATGFTLPDGWADPVEVPPKVVLHPREPDTFWRRTMKAFLR